MWQLGFDVDMGDGKFRVSVDRWEALKSETDAILSTQSRREGACPKALNLINGDGDFHETGMVANHAALREALVCLDQVCVLPELLGDPLRGSEGRAALLASPPFRDGYLALSQGRVPPDGNGCMRFCVGAGTYHD